MGLSNQEETGDSRGEQVSLPEPSIEVIRSIYPVDKLETIRPGTLTVGVSGEHPTDWFEGGRLLGIHGEVRQGVADILGLKVEPIDMLWPSQVEAVEASKIDVTGVGVAWSEERSRIFGFTQPFQYYYFGILQPKDSKIVDLTDLAGKRVAVVDPAINNPEVIGLLGEPNIFLYPNAAPIVADIVADRIDFGVYDFHNIEYAMNNHPKHAQFHVLPIEFNPQCPITTSRFPDYLMFMRNAVHLTAAADLAIDLLKVSGALREIYDAYGFNADNLLSIGRT